MKDEIVKLIKEHHYLNISDIAHELYITVADAKKYLKEAVDQNDIIFDEKSHSYHFNFKTLSK